MNNRQLTKYAIYAVAVLSATLVNQFILQYVKKQINVEGYLLVLMDMLIVILIFAPAFAFVSKYTKKLSKVYINTSRKVGSTSKKGTIFGFVIAIAILFILFALTRHQIDVIKDLKLLFSQD